MRKLPIAGADHSQAKITNVEKLMQEIHKLSSLLQQFKSISDENSISTYSFTPFCHSAATFA